MASSMTNAWRSERLFGMPALAADSTRGLDLPGSGSGCDNLVSNGYVSFEQVKPAIQPTHTFVGASSS